MLVPRQIMFSCCTGERDQEIERRGVGGGIALLLFPGHEPAQRSSRCGHTQRKTSRQTRAFPTWKRRLPASVRISLALSLLVRAAVILLPAGFLFPIVRPPFSPPWAHPPVHPDNK